MTTYAEFAITVDNATVAALRNEAAEHGDGEMVCACDRWLAGSEERHAAMDTIATDAADAERATQRADLDRLLAEMDDRRVGELLLTK